MLTEGGSGGEFGHPGRCRTRRIQPGFLEEFIARNLELLTETDFDDEDLISKARILEEQVDF